MKPEYPCTRENLLFRELDDEVVVYDPEADKVVVLNRSAAVIYEFCDGTRTPADIVAAVARVFGVKEERIASEIAEVLARFYSEGFIEQDRRGNAPAGMPHLP